MEMSFLWESHGTFPMGWDRHKLLWDGNGTDKYVPWTTLGFTCECHFYGNPMVNVPWDGIGWDRHKLLWDGNGTDKYVPWTTLIIPLGIVCIAVGKWQLTYKSM